MVSVASCPTGDIVDTTALGNPELKLHESSGNTPTHQRGLDLPRSVDTGHGSPPAPQPVEEIRAEGNRHLFAFQAVALCDKVCRLPLISGQAEEGAPLALAHVLGNTGTHFLWVQPAIPGMAELTAQDWSPPSTSLSPSHHTRLVEPPTHLPASRTETSAPHRDPRLPVTGHLHHGDFPAGAEDPGQQDSFTPGVIGPASGLSSL